MTEARLDPGVTTGRLPPEQYARNFADLQPPSAMPKIGHLA